MLRAALLGCGAIGAGSGKPHPELGVMTHAGAYVACPDTELVAVCDADGERARACAERWGGQAYTDPLALLAEQAPEIVSVATPDGTHAELVGAALGSGVRAVLAEKPLALSVAEAAALVELAIERDAVLAVNYTRRFVPAFRALAADTTLGALQHVSGVYVKGLKHNGTHWLDLLRLLAGEPVEVHGWDRLREGGEDPTLDAELTLASGAGARLAGLETERFTAFEMDLWFTGARIRVAEGGHVLERWDVGADPRNPGYRVLLPRPVQRGALRDGVLHAVQDVVRCLQEGGAPACTGADGVRALALADAIRASAGLPCTP